MPGPPLHNPKSWKVKKTSLEADLATPEGDLLDGLRDNEVEEVLPSLSSCGRG